MRQTERLERLAECKEKIQEVLYSYPGVELGWDCEEGSDLHGIYDDKVVITDGHVSLDMEGGTP